MKTSKLNLCTLESVNKEDSSTIYKLSKKIVQVSYIRH